jgi:hypothetical protein
MSKAILKRRTLLKQLGASAFLAGPVFRATLSEAQGSFPLRLILLNIPGGVPHVGGAGSDGGPDFFFANQQGSGRSETLAKPFATLQSDIIVVDNARQPAAEMVSAFYELEGHGGGCRTMFGGEGAGQGCGGPNACGTREEDAYTYGTATTIDQVVAAQVGASTRFGSLHFGSLWDKGQQGDHAESFFLNGQPVRPMSDPAAAFLRLFGNGVPAATGQSSGEPAVSPQALNDYYRGKSQLDKLRAEIEAIKQLAGSSEQAKLDAHLAALRDLEKSLPNIGGGQGMAGASCQLPSTPDVQLLDAKHDSYPMELPETSSAFNQIAFQAINCDLTRVLGLQWLSSGDHLPRFGWLGLKLDHHGMEHGSSPPEYYTAQAWILDQAAQFITMLKNTPEGTGSILDNSVVYLTSEMTEGNHIHSPAFQLVMGKAGGQFSPGRRIDATGHTVNDVMLSLIRAMGVQAATVGDPQFNGGALPLG